MEAKETDRQLAARLTDARDERAFHDLYQRHTTMLYGLAFRMCGNESDAMDAVHDAWVRAVDALPRFEWRSTFRSWLCGILLNRLRETSREAARMVLLDENDAIEELAELPRGVDVVDLERAVSELPPGYRQILLLHDLEGFKHEEIAGLLGIEPGTSKSQLARARRRVRMSLEKGDNVR